MSTNSKISGTKFQREFSRGMVRAMFASVFSSVITARKRQSGMTYTDLATQIGVGKSVISRWFNRDTNWEINSLSDISEALDVDLVVTARDRRTGAIYGPAGQIQTAAHTFTQAPTFGVMNVSGSTNASNDTIMAIAA